VPGKNIHVLEQLAVVGGSMDGGGHPDTGYVSSDIGTDIIYALDSLNRIATRHAQEVTMLAFLAANWLWMLLIGGMLVMHLGHRHHGDGHGGCGGGGEHTGHAADATPPANDAVHSRTTSPGEDNPTRPWTV
jgi:hypothetical protein